MRNRSVVFFRVAILFFYVLFFSKFVVAKEKMLILPFNFNSKNDLSFVQKGVLDILYFKSSKNDRFEVVDGYNLYNSFFSKKKFVNDNDVLEFAKKDGFLWVVSGSITVVEDVVSFQARMVNCVSGEAVVSVIKQIDGVKNILSETHLFADEIVGQKKSTLKNSKIHLKDEVSLDKVETDVIDDHADHGHEKKSQQALKKVLHFDKLLTIDEVIHSIAFANIDDDLSKEIVLATNYNVYVYKFRDNKFQRTQRLGTKKNNLITQVKVMDVNGNGYPEIFINSLNIGRNYINSAVFEYDGAKYKKLVAKSKVFYGSFSVNNMGDQNLMGQKNKIRDLFSGKIDRLKWSGNSYEVDNNIVPYNKISLSSFAYSDILNNGKKQFVFISDENFLEINSDDFNRVWKSAVSFEGRSFYFVKPKNEEDIENKQFFPPALMSFDFNQDLENELMVVKNVNSSGNLAKGLLGSGAKSQLVMYKWNGISLESIWKSNEFEGTVNDFVVYDFKKNDPVHILVPLVVRQGTGVLADKPFSVVFVIPVS